MNDSKPAVPMTGWDLLAALNDNAEWLSLPVHLLAMSDDAFMLTYIEQDCFDSDQGPVLSLVAEAVDSPERNLGRRRVLQYRILEEDVSRLAGWPIEPGDVALTWGEWVDFEDGDILGFSEDVQFQVRVKL